MSVFLKCKSDADVGCWLLIRLVISKSYNLSIAHQQVRKWMVWPCIWKGELNVRDSRSHAYL